jgi:4,5-DOPA dioxygenase extradiol
MPSMPAIFIGHGSPMNTLDSNRYTQTWRAIGAQLPKPRAIVAVSAHWYFGATAVTAMQRPRTIHDFYGFPPALFAFEYPAPGAPDVAAEVIEVVKPLWMGADQDQWGLDHGSWSVLAHVYPDADVPVIQLSINALKPMQYHLELAARLAPLREKGILILGSGNVVHNLRLIEWSNPDGGFDWAQRFDDAVVEQLAREPADILAMMNHPDYARAVPTPEHFIPLVYIAGLATKSEAPKAILRGYALGSLSMTCYAVGAEFFSEMRGAGAATLPDDVPPEDTNT